MVTESELFEDCELFKFTNFAFVFSKIYETKNNYKNECNKEQTKFSLSYEIFEKIESNTSYQE